MPARQRACGGSAVTSRPSKTDGAAIGAQAAGDEVERGGLAGAVRPDDAERLALARPRDVSPSMTCERAERLGDAVEREQRRHQVTRWRRRSA